MSKHYGKHNGDDLLKHQDDYIILDGYLPSIQLHRSYDLEHDLDHDILLAYQRDVVQVLFTDREISFGRKKQNIRFW